MLLKDYVAQKLTFLQISGKQNKQQGKQKQLPNLHAKDAHGTAPQKTSAPKRTEPATRKSDETAKVLPPQEPAESAVETPELPQPAAESQTALPEMPEPVPETVSRDAGEIPDLPAGQADFEAGMLACKEKNYAAALETLLRAAETGHKEAQFLCGQLYQRGLAADVNCKRALFWYKKSAKQGFLQAQLSCAAMYEEGLGADMNLKRALYWYEQAAKQGSVDAQLKCGRMYYCGRAETRNPKKSRVWLETAAGQGSEDAEKLLREYF